MWYVKGEAKDEIGRPLGPREPPCKSPFRAPRLLRQSFFSSLLGFVAGTQRTNFPGELHL